MNASAALAFAVLRLLSPADGPEGYLGLQTAMPAFSDVEEADADDPDLAAGLVVVAVVENSPAHQAGFAVGDRVLRVDGRAVRTPRHLDALIASRPAGSELGLDVRRGAAVLELLATTVARLVPRDAPRPTRLLETRRFAVAIASLGAVETLREGVPAGDGVRIERVLSAAISGGSGFAPGDIVLSLDGEAVHGPEDFIAIADGLDPGSPVEASISRDGIRRTARLRTRRAATRLHEVSIPPVVFFSDDPARDELRFGLLLGLFGYRHKERASTYRFLWLITFTTGTNEELEEIDAR